MKIRGQTVVALPVSARIRVQPRRSVPLLRSTARELPPRVVPLFRTRAFTRERSRAGIGLVVAFGFSALCWAGLATAIF